MLIILSDINGLYDKDPKVDKNAKIIKVVNAVDESLYSMAGGAGSRMGTGGMVTKLNAAKIANEAGIDVIIMNGSDPTDIYKALDSEEVGTLFKKQK